MPTAHKEGFTNANLAEIALAGGTTAKLGLQLNVAGGQTKVTVTEVPGEVRADEPSHWLRF
ncbi:MAG TPA: hypothetical protein VMT20_08245 [Terriglobia bacterium]|nr:hypothetical protein [Terriglobia bacterium]